MWRDLEASHIRLDDVLAAQLLKFDCEVVIVANPRTESPEVGESLSNSFVVHTIGRVDNSRSHTREFVDKL